MAPGYSCPTGTPTASAVHRRAARDAPRPPRPGGLPAARRHRRPRCGPRTAGSSRGRGRGCRGRLPIRLRRQLQPGAERPEQADRPLAAARRVHFGVWYSRLLPLHHVRLREHPASRRSGPTTSRSTTCRSTPTGSRPTSGTAGSGTRRCSPTRQAFLSWAKSAGHRRHAERPRQHRRQRPAAGRDAGPGGRTRCTDNACFSGTCKVWDWSQIAAGRVLLRAAPAVRIRGRRLLVAGLVLRRLDGVHARASRPTTGSTTSTRRTWPTRASAASSCPGPAAPTRTPTRSTRPDRGPATPPPSPSPATPGARGTRSPSRPSYPPTRPASTSRTSATTSAASSARRPGQPAGRRRPVRPLGPARHLPADPAAALQRRQPAALGLPAAGRRRSPPTSCGCARRSSPTPTRWPTQAVSTGLPITRPLYLDYPGQPRGVRPTRASTCTARTCSSPR